MGAKKTATVLLASVAFIALLGCVEQPECAGEGETIPVIAAPPECCAGLTLIPPKETGIIGISGYCTALCGNGSCDAIESNYNCPTDCVAEQQPSDQAVGPDYYGSEQEAFDALKRELDDTPEISTEDLEALLGE